MLAPRNSRDGLSISRMALTRLIGHCLYESPAEAVGLLVGASNAVHMITPLRNIVPSPNNRRAFVADPYSQFQAERQILSVGSTLVAVYHSHPDGGPSLSDDDILLTPTNVQVHVVVAFPVSEPQNIIIRAYRIINGNPLEVSIVVPE